MHCVRKYIHLFELTITLECWLDQDEFTREELELATEFIPLFTETFVVNVKRSKGQKMKLAKIHQLHHFVPQIYHFGAAKNISGRIIGESNLKEKVKCLSEQIWYQQMCH